MASLAEVVGPPTLAAQLASTRTAGYVEKAASCLSTGNLSCLETAFQLFCSFSWLRQLGRPARIPALRDCMAIADIPAAAGQPIPTPLPTAALAAAMATT